ncbi:MAG: type II/IV secretion system protein [Phycisphaerales bacterium]|nr:MAG: type II/IV secretion system protein [Phycisphaerales bacterium]
MAFVSTQVEGLVSAPCLGATALPFDPIRLVLLIAWIYLGMYCVQRIQVGALVPAAYRTVASVFTLFTGPTLLLILAVIEAAKKSRQSRRGFFDVLGEQVRHALAGIQSIAHRSQENEETLRLLDSSGRPMDEIYGHGQVGGHEDARILDRTETIVADALERRASDILIDPKDESAYTIRLRIDGVLRLTEELNAETCRAIVNSIKAVSGMDIAERRRPQDGAFLARRGDATYSFRVASAGALNGEKLSIRVLNKDAGTTTLDSLGISSKQQVVIDKIMHKPSGMILICGPTGSGKTTTMYAMLNAIDRFERNVITVEDPIEAVLPETSQIEINRRADITFAKTLRSILRQDPDVICIGEIRDEETAEIALRASQTGHLVLATLHCDSNATALVRLLDLGVSPLLLSSGLSLVMSQRLLRCLCENCKQPAALSDSQIAQLRQKRVNHAEIFEAGQCKRCDRTGFFGRTAICDLLVIDEQVKAKIAQGQSFLAQLKAEGTKQGRSKLRKQGMKKVLSGVTGFKELKRVVG